MIFFFQLQQQLYLFHSFFLFSYGPMFHWSNCACVLRSNGPIVQRSNGPMVHGPNGPPVQRSHGHTRQGADRPQRPRAPGRGAAPLGPPPRNNFRQCNAVTLKLDTVIKQHLLNMFVQKKICSNLYFFADVSVSIGPTALLDYVINY